MALELHAESHLDHGLSPEHVAFLMKTFADKAEFFIEKVTLPEELGAVPCGLHGPVMGDAPVPEEECAYIRRGTRDGLSRMCRRPARLVRDVTVIAGPHDGNPCVLYTAFGGPSAFREPFDTSLSAEDVAKSKEFWKAHALSLGE